MADDRKRDRTEYNRRYYKKNRTEIIKKRHDFYQQNKEKYAKKARKYFLKKKFGMTIEDYNNMFEAQNGKCKICGNNHTNTMDIDHDHTTGVIRGLLCRQCNQMLGLSKDNPLILIRAINYIRGDYHSR